MTDARTKEAIRYLGYGRHAVDEQTLALIDVSFGELDQTTQAKSVYRIFDCKVTGEDQVTIGKMNIKSRSLGKNLRGCKEAVVFGATLGTSVDILMKRYSLTDMAKTSIGLSSPSERCKSAIANNAINLYRVLREHNSPYH